MIKIANNLHRLLTKQVLSSSYPNFVNHSTDPASPALGVGNKPPVSMLPEYAAQYDFNGPNMRNMFPSMIMSPEDYAALVNTHVAEGNQRRAGLGQLSLYGASDPMHIVEYGPDKIERYQTPSIAQTFYNPINYDSVRASTTPLSGPLPVTPRSQQLQNSRRVAKEYFNQRGMD